MHSQYFAPYLTTSAFLFHSTLLLSCELWTPSVRTVGSPFYLHPCEQKKKFCNTAMLVLFETPAGFALFKVLDEGKVKNVDALKKSFNDPEKAQKMFANPCFFHRMLILSLFCKALN